MLGQDKLGVATAVMMGVVLAHRAVVSVAYRSSRFSRLTLLLTVDKECMAMLYRGSMALYRERSNLVGGRSLGTMLTFTSRDKGPPTHMSSRGVDVERPTIRSAFVVPPPHSLVIY